MRNAINLSHVKTERIDCFVHSDGRVFTYHKRFRRFVQHKTYIDADGYIRLSIQHKNVGLHQLLALAFIPNPDGKTTVDHIDRNKLNNRLDNLRWASVAEQNDNKEHHRKTDEEKKQTVADRIKRKRLMGLTRLKRDGHTYWLPLSERKFAKKALL